MTHPTGTPAWIDLMTTDLPSAEAFYGAIFGWQFEEQPSADGSPYAIARHNGRDAAGLAYRTAEEREQGIPPSWNLFFATDDAERACS